MAMRYLKRSRAAASGLLSVMLVAWLAVAGFPSSSSAAAPPAPRSVHATAGNRLANVSWSKPASAGLVLSGYVVTARPGTRGCATSSTGCTVWGLVNGTSYTFRVVAKYRSGASAPSTQSNPVTPKATLATLAYCPVVGDWPIKPVPAAVVAVIGAYYSAKHLAPVRVIDNQEMVLNVHEQSVGTHRCRNAGGPSGGYVGVVPARATAAVMVHVRHKPYPVTQNPDSFVTLALVPSLGWRVVGEGTGP
jgi:Fibronectin type III domain